VAVALRYAARSDVGLIRKNNQDSGYAGPHLLVVADGMGGAAGGDVASSVVVSHLAPLDDDTPTGDLLTRLKEAVYAAHDELVDRVAEDPSLAGLGTTVIALLRSGNRFAMIHIGDSRAYVVRDGQMFQVTTDHTFVQHLVDTGQLTPEQAEHHPQRSVLLRVLGDNSSDIVLDEWAHEARIGDRWLLCSDGLSGVVSAETIAHVLGGTPDVGECAEALVALALHGGGPDNVTCIVADVIDLDALPDGTAPALDPQVVGAAATDRLRPTRGGAGAAGRAAALGTPDAAAPAQPAVSVPGSPSAGVDADDGGRPSGRSRRVIAWLVGITLVLGAVAAAGALAYRWTQEQYYVGIEDGYVAIFQGIPQELGRTPLSSVHARTTIAVEDLPAFARQRLEDTIMASTLAEAEAVVALLEEEAAPPPTPEPTADPNATPAPSAPVVPAATVGAAPAPGASRGAGA
jgi:serine/threonine protein phosphatase PrpC